MTRREGRKLVDDAVKTLKASPAIDHWQKGRERIEAEDLLAFVLGEELEPTEQIGSRAEKKFRDARRSPRRR